MKTLTRVLITAGSVAAGAGVTLGVYRLRQQRFSAAARHYSQPSAPPAAQISSAAQPAPAPSAQNIPSQQASAPEVEDLARYKNLPTHEHVQANSSGRWLRVGGRIVNAPRKLRAPGQN